MLFLPRIENTLGTLNVSQGSELTRKHLFQVSQGGHMLYLEYHESRGGFDG